MKFVRKYHRWLMLLVGLQFLIWSVTGLYMVSMDIHYIHGEPLQKKQEQTLNLTKVSFSINTLLARYPNAKDIALVKVINRQVYRFKDGEKGQRIVDATTGKLLPEIDQVLANNIALYSYAGEEEILSSRLITQVANLPPELSPRHLPVWQIVFDHVASPTFYISQQSGAIVTKRHNYWRLFDWMWRFHIMDYDDGENIANGFLFVIALLGMMAALTGAVLTYFRVFRTKKRQTK